MMAFYYPHLIWPLLLLSFIWIFYYIYSEKHFFSFIALYWDKRPSLSRKTSTLFYLCAIGLFFAFFLRPIRTSYAQVPTLPVTIFLIDQSLSMSATDILPSRYERGIDWIKAFLGQQTELKGAIWGVRERAVALTAITEDRFYLQKYLEDLKQKKEVGGGSRLDHALFEVVDSLSKQVSSWERVHLIFITDGEQHEKRFIKKLLHPSLTLSFVYVGHEKGGELNESYQGHKIVSRPSFQFHEAWKEEGYFVYAVSALDPHSPNILSLELKNSASFFRTTPIEAEYSRYIVILSLIFLSLSLLLRYKKNYISLILVFSFLSPFMLSAKDEKKLWEQWKRGKISKEERFEYLEHIQKKDKWTAIIGYEELFSKNGLYDKESLPHLFNYGTLLWAVNRFEEGEKIYVLIKNRLKGDNFSLVMRLMFEEKMRANRFFAVLEFMRREAIMKKTEKKDNEDLQTIFKNKKKSFYQKWFDDDQLGCLRKGDVVDVGYKGEKQW